MSADTNARLPYLYIPDWNDLPESARVAACQCAEEYWGEALGGQAALDIYNEIRRECLDPSYLRPLPMKL